MQRNIGLLGLIVLIISSCQLGDQKNEWSTKAPESYKVEAYDPEILHETFTKLTEIIVYDIFSPPVASRVYVYPSIAAYEVMANDDDSYISLAGQLSELGATPKPTKQICSPYAALVAHLVVSKVLVFSEDKIDEQLEKIQLHFRKMGVSPEIIEASQRYGERMAKHIIEWSSKDNYHQSRTFAKHHVLDENNAWQPTPPSYMEAIEPHWNKIRPFVIDSAQQFKPTPPTPFNLDKESLFYKELMEVYEVTKNIDSEKLAIASFWDCNPYVMNLEGHVMFATKKITPGGHWVGITGIACRTASSNFMEAIEAYAYTTVSLADGFISCWDEKYRSNLIRPETVINEYIDQEWLPPLQTPPFPEYTSGHSVISTAAAYALTSLFGDNFAYTDSVEVVYGLPPRDFSSFIKASEEAAVSRLYGGIHYRPAIDNGIDQGKAVSKLIIDRIKTRKDTSISQAKID